MEEFTSGENISEKSARVVKSSSVDLTSDAVGPHNTGVMIHISPTDTGGNNDISDCANTSDIDSGVNQLHQNWDSFNPRMALENFAVGPMIGKGNFGRVYPAYYGGKHPAALKVFRSVAFHPENMYKERDLMIELKHKNVCKIRGAFFNGRSFLVLELCIGNVAYMSTIAKPRSIASWTVHLLRALEYLHYRDTIHCDVCPENCLIGYDGILKLSDFGSAEKLSLDETEIKSDWLRGHPKNQDDVTNEHFLYSKRSDIFSAACCIFYMTTLEYLLGYDIDVKPEEYVLTYKLGRKIAKNLKDLEDPNAPRQPLMSRVKQSDLGKLLQPMIVESKFRVITPQLALQHYNLQDVLQRYHVSDVFIDNGEKTRGGSLMFTKREFNLDTKHFVEGTELSQNMSAFYYDSECFQGHSLCATRKQLGPSGRIWVEIETNQPATETPPLRKLELGGQKATSDPTPWLSFSADSDLIRHPQTSRLTSPIDYILLDSNLTPLDKQDEVAPDDYTVLPKKLQKSAETRSDLRKSNLPKNKKHTVTVFAAPSTSKIRSKGKKTANSNCKNAKVNQDDKEKKQANKNNQKANDKKIWTVSEQRRRKKAKPEEQTEEQNKLYREGKAKKDKKCNALQNKKHKHRDDKEKNEKVTEINYESAFETFAVAEEKRRKKREIERSQMKKEERERKVQMKVKIEKCQKQTKTIMKKYWWECPACDLMDLSYKKIKNHIEQVHPDE